MKKLVLIFIAVIMAFASCKKTPDVTPEVGVLKAITLSKDTLKMNVADTKTIVFTLTPSTYDKTTLVWHSSDSTIISVNNSGVITAKKEGEAIVSVSNLGATVTKFCLISVLPELKSITLTKDTLKMNAGDTKSINFTTTPSNYNKTALVWHSSDTTIVSVNNSGAVTAKKEGEAIVSISNQGKTVTAFCLISVKPGIPKIDSLKVGLIAYYPFNYDSAVDSSEKRNDGTIFDITSVPDRFGKPNSAYYFNGSSSYIQVKDNQDLRLSNTDFTINTWVNLSDYNLSYGSFLMSKRTSGIADGWGFSITGYGFQSSGQGGIGLTYFGPGGGNAVALGNTSMSTNRWYMITTVYNLNQQEIKVYINGILDNTISNIPPPNAQIAADIYIGRDNPSAPTTGYFVKGKIDDIRIYNRMLKSSDIQKLYNLTY